MSTKRILLVSAAMTALLLGGCTTQKVEPFTQTSIEGSDIQSVPTPLATVPDAAPVEVGSERDGGPVPAPPSVLAVPSISADGLMSESVTVTGSGLGKAAPYQAADPSQ